MYKLSPTRATLNMSPHHPICAQSTVARVGIINWTLYQDPDHRAEYTENTSDTNISFLIRNCDQRERRVLI